MHVRITLKLYPLYCWCMLKSLLFLYKIEKIRYVIDWSNNWLARCAWDGTPRIIKNKWTRLVSVLINEWHSFVKQMRLACFMFKVGSRCRKLKFKAPNLSLNVLMALQRCRVCVSSPGLSSPCLPLHRIDHSSNFNICWAQSRLIE